MKLACVTLLLTLPGVAGVVEEAIRRNDLVTLRKLAHSLPAPNGKSTPLHYAAAYGTPESLKLLLSAGPDVNVRDAGGATPLFLAATSLEKTRVLLKAGADPKLATRMGRTPLHMAAAQQRGADIVKALLAAGAVVDAESERGGTPLMDAATYGSTETIRLLLARGADANKKDKAGMNALLAATNYGDSERIKLLLAAGADPNSSNTFAGMVRKGPIALTGLTPLLLASAHGPAASVRMLLDAGAKLDVKDGRGLTLLQAARTADGDNDEILAMLTRAGAADTDAAPVADVALRRREKPVPPASAVDAALGAVARSGSEFFKESGCVGCHHQPIAAMAFRKVGRTASVAAEEMKRGILAARPLEPLLTQLVDPGGDTDSVGWLLVGASAASVPADSLTDAAVRYLLSRQRTDGSWRSYGVARPPFEEGTIGRTAVVMQALRAYPWPAIQTEVDAALARGREWLLQARPRHTYERAELLLALKHAAAPTDRLKQVAAALLADQRADGGWAQTAKHATDAYATGLALHALHESGMLKTTAAAYGRGAQWLLANQLEDGTWHVRSRSPRFQPYFESGFPHGHDQWISAPATAYAAMALAPLAAESDSTKVASSGNSR